MQLKPALTIRSEMTRDLSNEYYKSLIQTAKTDLVGQTPSFSNFVRARRAKLGRLDGVWSSPSSDADVDVCYKYEQLSHYRCDGIQNQT